MIKHTTSSSQLRLNGHTYYKKDTANGNVYWRCTLFRRGQCGATAITRQTPNGIKIIKEGVHGHPATAVSHEHNTDIEGDTDESSEVSDHSYAENDDVEEVVSSDRDSDSSDDSDVENTEEKHWETWEEESDGEEEMESEDMENDEDEIVEEEEQSDDGDSFSLLTDKLQLHNRELQNLSTESGLLREAVLKEADKGLICFLCEIAWNMLNGYFDLKSHEINLLRLFQNEIRVLANEDIRWHEKKEALIARANDPIIPILLNVLLPHLS